MSYEPKPNSGSLWKNDKDGNEKRPDYTGRVNVAGADYFLSAWIKTVQGGERKGEKYMSLSVKPADEKRGRGKSDDNSGIPF